MITYECPNCRRMAGIGIDLEWEERHKHYVCDNCWAHFSARYLKQLRKDEMKEVIVNTTANGTIYELKFKTLPRKGYFAENIQPIINLIKAMIPATAREYNPSTFTWGLGAEYWPPLKTSMEALGFKITMLDKQPTSGPKVHVPTDYAENFYYTAPTSTKESPQSIAEQLSQYLGVEITTQDLSDLKKLYRAKAREYHPDMGGDAKKMSELNRLWTLYSNKEVTQ